MVVSRNVCLPVLGPPCVRSHRTSNSLVVRVAYPIWCCSLCEQKFSMPPVYCSCRLLSSFSKVAKTLTIDGIYSYHSRGGSGVDVGWGPLRSPSGGCYPMPTNKIPPGDIIPCPGTKFQLTSNKI